MQLTCVILASGPITVEGAVMGGMLYGSIVGIPTAVVMTMLSRKGSKRERFMYTLFTAIVSTIGIMLFARLVN